MGADLSKGKYTKMGGKLSTQTSSDGAEVDLNESYAGGGGNVTLNSSGMSANADTDPNDSNVSSQDVSTDNASSDNHTNANDVTSSESISEFSGGVKPDMNSTIPTNPAEESGQTSDGVAVSELEVADSKSTHFGKLKGGLKFDIIGKFSKYETLPTKEDSIDE